MELPRNHTVAGLRRIIADPDTAVRFVSYTDREGATYNTFGTLTTGVDYWPTHQSGRAGRGTHPAITFLNSPSFIAYMWPDSWTYVHDDDGAEVIATRQSSPDGPRLVIRLHQPNLLAANWSASIEPDRIEDDQ